MLLGPAHHELLEVLVLPARSQKEFRWRPVMSLPDRGPLNLFQRSIIDHHETIRTHGLRTKPKVQ